MNTFIPQALADEASRQILFVFSDEEEFNRCWKDKIRTIDAPGVEVHPSEVRVGDLIDSYITGWTKTRVVAIEFVSERTFWETGYYRLTTEDGFRCFAIVHGKAIGSKLYKFS